MKSDPRVPLRGWYVPLFCVLVFLACAGQRTLAADAVPPSTPTGLTAKFLGPTSFTLGWSAATDNVAVTNYEVFRGVVSLGTVGNVLTKPVTGLTPTTTYNLTVRAGDAAGNWSDVSLPLQVTTPPSIAHGGCFTLAVRSDGTVWAWGYNGFGQLGDGTTISRSTPVQVSGLTNVTMVAAGANHSLALKKDGTVWWWGGANASQLTPTQIGGSSYVAIAAGDDFTLLLTTSGWVEAWGRNDHGQSGGSNFSAAVTSPTSIVGGVTGIAAGQMHALALKSDGTVVAWGCNQYGQLGNGSTADSYAPVTVGGLTSVVALAGGSYHSLALKNDGSVKAWGLNNCGQLGTGNTTDYTTPQGVSSLTNVMAIGTGGYHSTAVKGDGTVWSWGYNPYGQLGDGSTVTNASPVQASGVTGATTVATGPTGNYTFVAKSDGTLREWGLNDFGQLGDGTTTYRTTAVTVANLSVLDTVAPSIPTNLVATFFGPTSLTLSWSAATDNIGVTTYEVFRGAISLGTTTSLSKTIVGLSASTAYNLTVRAGDASGNWSSASVPLPVATTPSLARGSSHSLAVKSDGTVAAWGANNYGQLGDGTTTNRPAPVSVGGLTNVAMVAAGFWHSVALKNDGTVWIWGWNPYHDYYYDISDGLYHWNGENRTAPVQVSGLTNVVAVAAGRDFTLALKADGTVWAWGRNDYRQMGNNGAWGSVTIDWPTPTQVTNTALGSTVVAIAAGDTHALALKSDGTVYGWGYNGYGQTGIGSPSSFVGVPTAVSGLTGVVAIAAGPSHSVALKSDGTMKAWGSNGYGQLGDGTTTGQASPVSVSGLSGVVAIGAGEGFSSAVKSDNTVWSWGYNASGQLGDGTTTNRTTAVQATGVTGAIALAIGSSGDQALVSKNDGTALAWGLNSSGQIGDGSTTTRTGAVTLNNLSLIDTTPPTAPTNVQAKFLGPTSLTLTWNAATDDVGVTVYEVFRGTMSLGTTTALSKAITGLSASTAYSLTVRAGDAAGHWSALSASVVVTTAPSIARAGCFALATRSDGTVWAWGYNGFGQLGDGTTATRSSPVQVSGLTNVAMVAAGVNHSVALKSDGTVWGWGYNAYDHQGYDGNGNYVWFSANQTTPVQKTGLAGVIAIAAGNDFTLALKSDGTVWSWGANNDGQLGLGSTTATATPTSTGMTGVVAIAAGHGFALAVKSDGTVWSWGNNTGGQLGLNLSYAYLAYPAQISGLTGVVAVAGGILHALALKNDGTVKAWGYNNSGQLGTGNTTSYGTPQSVVGLANMISIGAGGTHSAAVKNDGTVWSWGDNYYGQLGDGTTASNATPLQTAGISGACFIATGPNGDFTFVAKSDGTLREWGLNNFGQLGDGTTTNRLAAVQPIGFSPDSTPPTAPTSLVASNITATSLTLSWTAATDNVAVTAYLVYRDSTPVGTTATTSMSISGLDALAHGVTLSVRARDLIGNLSPDAEITVNFSDQTAPTTPTGLNYAHVTGKSVTLVWNGSTDNIGVAGYNIYRGGTLVGTTDQLIYTDINLSASTSYSYTVKAFDAVPNLSTASSTLTITTTSDFSADADHDGIPDAVETALGTNGSSATSDTTNQTGQNIHRPLP